jgi:lysophospholipase L1-like esterase
MAMKDAPLGKQTPLLRARPSQGMKRLALFSAAMLCAVAAQFVPDVSARVASPSRPLVIALGDSITYGFGLARPSTQNYAAQFAQRMHDRFVDLAVPGYGCDDVIQSEVPKMPPGAAVVILNCGTNDIGGFGFTPAGLPDGHKRAAPATVPELRKAENTFTQLLSAIRMRERSARIVVLTIRDWQRMTGNEDRRFVEDVDAWNRFIRMGGVRVVDIAADRRMYQPAYFEADLIHPNLAGNKAIVSDLR